MVRLVWLIFGCVIGANAVLWLWPSNGNVTTAQPAQLTAGHNEIVFPANPGILRSGAITNRYPLVFQKIPAPIPMGRPGAIASIGETTLLMTRVGVVLRLEDDVFQPMDIPSPFDLDRMSENLPVQDARTRLGIYDLKVRQAADNIEMFVSYAHHDAEMRCVSLRVAHLELTPDFDAKGRTWQDIYRSEPCVDSVGNQISLLAGGSLFPDGESLLISVGTFSLNRTKKLDTQAFFSDATDYGKIIELDLKTGTSSILSTGHRDPTGLARDKEGRLWSVEQGPRGGDELNLIRGGGNYGWPWTTYGTQYGRFTWTRFGVPDQVPEFVTPHFSWIPSAAVSSMLIVQGRKFPDWRNDILVSSLKGGQLFRLRQHEGRIIFSEPILIGDRVRDVTETDAGDILLLLDRLPWVLRLENRAPNVANAAIEVTYCAACHQVSTDHTGAFPAPSLVGIVGRRIASAEGFPYTDGLKALDGEWTPERIVEFVKFPQRIAPKSTHPEMDIANFKLNEAVSWLAAQQ